MTTIDLDALTSRAQSADADGRFVSVEPGTMLALIDALKVAREALEPLKLLADDVDREFDGFVTPRPGYRVAVSFGDCLKARVALAALSSLLAPARTGKSDAEIREVVEKLRTIAALSDFTKGRVAALDWVLQARTEGNK